MSRSIIGGSQAAGITMSDIDSDDWNMLPSSTMMPYHLEQMILECHFTPKKSLRALVMAKSAKRQATDLPTEIIDIPQGNSSEIDADVSETNDVDDLATYDSDHYVSRRRYDAILDVLYMKLRQKELQEVTLKRRNNLSTDFIFPSNSSFGAHKGLKSGPTNVKSNAKRRTPLLNSLPPNLREELNCKQPKRLSKTCCSKRLATKLEHKQEKKNIPDSSGSESVSSIVLPRRQLFTQRDVQPNNNVWPYLKSGEAHTELQNPSMDNKTMEVSTKKHFGQEQQRTKTRTPNKTVTNDALKNAGPQKFSEISREVNKTETTAGYKNLFSEPHERTKYTSKVKDRVSIFFDNQQKNRKNMLHKCIASESRGEIPEIQATVFGLHNKFKLKRRTRSMARSIRGVSQATSDTMGDIDSYGWWMMADQREQMNAETSMNRMKFSNLTDRKETSEDGKLNTTADQTIQQNKSPLKYMFKSNRNNSKTTVSKIGIDTTVINKTKRLNKSVSHKNIPQNSSKDKNILNNEINFDDADNTGNKTKKTTKSVSVSGNEIILILSSESEIEQYMAQEENELRQSDEDQNELEDEENEFETTFAEEKQEEKNDVNEEDGESTNESIAEEQENELDESEMMADQLEQMKAETAINRMKFSNLTDRKETSESSKENTTVGKTIQRNKSTSKNISKSKQNNSKTTVSGLGIDTTVTNKSKRINKSVSPKNISQISSEDKDILNNEINFREVNNAGNKTKQANKSISVSDNQVIEILSSESEVEQYMAQEENELQESDEDQNELEDEENEFETTFSEEQQEESFVQEEKNHVQEEDGESTNEFIAKKQEHELEKCMIQRYEDNEEEQTELEQPIEGYEMNDTDKNNNEEIQGTIEQAGEENETNENCEKEKNTDQSNSEDLENEFDVSGIQNNDDIEDSEEEQSSEYKKKYETAEQEEDICLEYIHTANVEETEDQFEVSDSQSDDDNEENIAELGQSMKKNDQSVDLSAELKEEYQENEQNIEIEEEYDEEIDQDDQEILHMEDVRDYINTSPNISYDTTGRNVIKMADENKTKSPEAELINYRNTNRSFIVKGRNTCVRNTKRKIRTDLRPSTASSVRYSISTTGSNSSDQRSGWDSHINEREILRNEFGSDFTPRKSLRAMMKAKSTKPEINGLPIESIDTSLANSSKINTDISEPIDVNYFMTDESDHDVSRRTRYEISAAKLDKVKEDILARKQREKEELQKGALKCRHNPFDDFLFPSKSRFRDRKGLVVGPTNVKSNAKRLTPFLNSLSPDLREELSYKPPKRFNKASWCTKRLYKFLETKLEPMFDFMARREAEALVEKLYNFGKGMKKHKTAALVSIDEIKYEMARLKIVETHFDFYNFFQNYLPAEMCMKVIPDIVNKIPLPPGGIYSNILEDDLHRHIRRHH